MNYIGNFLHLSGEILILRQWVWAPLHTPQGSSSLTRVQEVERAVCLPHPHNLFPSFVSKPLGVMEVRGQCLRWITSLSGFQKCIIDEGVVLYLEWPWMFVFILFLYCLLGQCGLSRLMVTVTAPQYLFRMVWSDWNGKTECFVRNNGKKLE